MRRSIVLAALLGSTSPALAAGPAVLGYEGFVADSQGKPIHGPLAVTFALFPTDTGGNALWSEPQAVEAVHGRLSALLGTQVSIPLPTLATAAFLEITIGAETLSPRAQITALPFALTAAICDTATGDLTPRSVSVAGATVIDDQGHWVGPNGPSGPAGPAGQGVVGSSEPAGANCAQGGLKLVSSTGTTFVCHGGSGAQGAVGPMGLVGPIGLAGTAGAIGAAGPQGPVGIQGPAGMAGPAGSQGAPGSPGGPGPQGGAGPAGPAGPSPAANGVKPPVANRITTVDSTSSANTGQFTSITIGGDGLPVVAYYDSVGGNLMVAKCVNASCTGTSTLTAVDSPGDVGRFASIALGSDGFPVIAYYDATNTDLKFAKCNTHTCGGGTAPDVTTVDVNAADRGQYAAVVIGGDGFPVLSYQDATAGSEMLLTRKCGDARCSTTTGPFIADSSTTGFGNSMTVGADGLPIMSCRDAGGNLRTSRCDSPGCDTTFTARAIVTSPNGPTAGVTAIAIGADRLPIIAYQIAAGFHRTAKCTTPSCGGAPLEFSPTSGPSSGLHMSMAIGHDGLPVFSFYDAVAGDLMLAKCQAPDCIGPGAQSASSIRADTGSGGANDTGQFTSITIAPDGAPVVSYFDVTAADLRILKCANPFCSPFMRRR